MSPRRLSASTGILRFLSSLSAPFVPLCFQSLPTIKFSNPFLLTTMQNGRGVGTPHGSRNTVHGPRSRGDSFSCCPLSAVSCRLSASSASLATRHSPLSFLECALPRFRRLTPLDCAVPKTRSPKPFRMRSSEKKRGEGSPHRSRNTVHRPRPSFSLARPTANGQRRTVLPNFAPCHLLCFHPNTNCPICKPFVLIFIQIAGGCIPPTLFLVSAHSKGLSLENQ